MDRSRYPCNESLFKIFDSLDSFVHGMTRAWHMLHFAPTCTLTHSNLSSTHEHTMLNQKGVGKKVVWVGFDLQNSKTFFLCVSFCLKTHGVWEIYRKILTPSPSAANQPPFFKQQTRQQLFFLVPIHGGDQRDIRRNGSLDTWFCQPKKDPSTL